MQFIRSRAAEPPRISDAQFALRPEGLSDNVRRTALKKLNEYLDHYQDNFLGYQVNQDLRDVARDLPHLLRVHTNNVGDPFTDSNLMAHTKPLERAVLDYYARLWGAEPYRDTGSGDPAELETAWGYVLSMGSSEGNIYGLLNARDYLSGKYLMARPQTLAGEGLAQVPQLALAQAPLPDDNPNAYSPVAFFSEDTHYSVAKAAHTLHIPTFGQLGNSEYRDDARQVMGTESWPLEVPSQGGDAGPGSIDVDKLVKAVDFFASKGHPILVVLNLGSTFKGAYDDAELVCERLGPVFRRHGLDRRTIRQEDGTRSERAGYWIHIDGALGANYLPFLRMAQEQNRIDTEPRLPRFDFGLPWPGINSIVASGHKYPGCPWPSGVFMTRRKYQLKPPPMPAYTGSPDTTFAGSRNAFSAAVLWNFFAKHSFRDQVEMAARCHDMAKKTAKALRRVDARLRKRGKDGLEVAVTPHALSVRFRTPTPAYVRKYSLANVSFTTDSDRRKTYAHLFTMPHVTEAKIRELVRDLMREDAFTDRAEVSVRASELIPAQYTPVEESAEVMAVAMDRGFA